jgi:hypothetical protein
MRNLWSFGVTAPEKELGPQTAQEDRKDLNKGFKDAI